jgi:hypothetical protein
MQNLLHCTSEDAKSLGFHLLATVGLVHARPLTGPPAELAKVRNRLQFRTLSDIIFDPRLKAPTL